LTPEQQTGFDNPETRKPAPSQNPLKPVAAFLSSVDLAKALGSDKYRNRVDLALRLFAKTNRDCREEVKAPRKGEPRVLYRVEQVWPLLLAKLPKWRDSSTTTD
jgi:hypothetical protein